MSSTRPHSGEPKREVVLSYNKKNLAEAEKIAAAPARPARDRTLVEPRQPAICASLAKRERRARQSRYSPRRFPSCRPLVVVDDDQPALLGVGHPAQRSGSFIMQNSVTLDGIISSWLGSAGNFKVEVGCGEILGLPLFRETVSQR
jgi:hypothetical protein